KPDEELLAVELDGLAVEPVDNRLAPGALGLHPLHAVEEARVVEAHERGAGRAGGGPGVGAAAAVGKADAEPVELVPNARPLVELETAHLVDEGQAPHCGPVGSPAGQVLLDRSLLGQVAGEGGGRPLGPVAVGPG